MADALKLNDSESLERWLDDKPADWARLIGLRAALRAFPLVAIASSSNTGNDRNVSQGLALAVWRCLLIVSIVSKYPSREMRAAADNASGSAFYKIADIPSTSAAATATAAAFAVAESVSSADAGNNVAGVIYAVDFAIDASDKIEADANIFARGGNSVAWEAIRCDCYILERGGPEKLEAARLWLEHGLNQDDDLEPVLASPVWVEKVMPHFSSNMIELLGPFSALFVDWYQSLFAGRRDANWSRMFLGDQARKLALKGDVFWRVTEKRPAEQITRNIAEALGWKDAVYTSDASGQTMHSFIAQFIENEPEPQI